MISTASRRRNPSQGGVFLYTSCRLGLAEGLWQPVTGPRLAPARKREAALVVNIYHWKGLLPVSNHTFGLIALRLNCVCKAPLPGQLA